MIIFEGDFVQLVQNFHGNDDEWLRVVECEPYDIALLSNGARVPATDAYIRGVRSEKEHVHAEYKRKMDAIKAKNIEKEHSLALQKSKMEVIKERQMKAIKKMTKG